MGICQGWPGHFHCVLLPHDDDRVFVFKMTSPLNQGLSLAFNANACLLPRDPWQGSSPCDAMANLRLGPGARAYN